MNYGEAGINLLIDTLNNDPVLTIRATAYQYLQQAITEQSKPVLKQVELAIANGIPLKKGDRLYRVYISAIDYDDEYHTLLDSVQAHEAHNFCYDGEISYPVERYIFREQADQVAIDLHRVILSNASFAEFNHRHQLKLKSSDYYLFQIAGDLCNFYRNYSQPVHDWCVAYNVDVDLSDYLSKDISNNEIEYWWEAQEAVFEKLQDQRNYQLLEELCDFVEMGKFAFVHEEIVDRDSFFSTTR